MPRTNEVDAAIALELERFQTYMDRDVMEAQLVLARMLENPAIMASANSPTADAVFRTALTHLPAIAREDAEAGGALLQRMLLTASESKSLREKVLHAGLGIFRDLVSRSVREAAWAFDNMMKAAYTQEINMDLFQQIATTGMDQLATVAELDPTGDSVKRMVGVLQKNGHYVYYTEEMVQQLLDVGDDVLKGLEQPASDENRFPFDARKQFLSAVMQGTAGDLRKAGPAVQAALDALDSLGTSDNRGKHWYDLLPRMYSTARSAAGMAQEVTRRALETLPRILRESFWQAEGVLHEVLKARDETISDPIVLSQRFLRTTETPDSPGVWFLPWQDAASGLTGLTAVKPDYNGDIPGLRANIQTRRYAGVDSERILRHAGIFARAVAGNTPLAQAAEQITADVKALQPVVVF